MIPLSLNWFGMAVHDVRAASEFYAGKLGFASVEHEATDSWRYFETRRMTFELFKAHTERVEVKAWGDGQAFRPLLLVQDLAATASELVEKRIPISNEESEFEARIEMVGPEGIRWGLTQDTKVATDWIHPLVAGIELKAKNLEAQVTFYTKILGMTVDRETVRGIHLLQSDAEAWLRIVPGGRPASAPTEKNPHRPAFFHPTWISFETQAVKDANDWLSGQNVNILRPLTYREDWKGTDILLADADGSVVQVVQYG